MLKRGKYKMWTVRDFETINKMRSNGLSCIEIANHLEITKNCLYKAIRRYGIYQTIQVPDTLIKVCFPKEIYEIAIKSGIKIKPSTHISDLLVQINLLRKNTGFPKIILSPY